MAAIIELKYFNTFWLKKIKSITDIVPNANTGISFASNIGTAFTVTGNLLNPAAVVAAGQKVTIVNGSNVYSSYVVEVVSASEFTAESAPVFTITGTPNISFGKIINFDNIPQAYTGNNNRDWLIEESRIRGGYNNTSVDYGVKAYLVEDEPDQSNKFSSLIHSGIFNSRTGINQTNQFSVGEDITRTIDPANGSIQKLYSEDTNLIIFQENKVSRSLIDKDAIYSAEGNASIVGRNLVIGQNVAYAGEYGISKDPESFAVNGYRKYFTDRDQNVVCRLSMTV